jgi:hypothetical protein
VLIAAVCTVQHGTLRSVHQEQWQQRIIAAAVNATAAAVALAPLAAADCQTSLLACIQVNLRAAHSTGAQVFSQYHIYSAHTAVVAAVQHLPVSMSLSK